MTEESSLAQVEPLAPDHGGPKAPGVNVSSGKPEITFNEAPATHNASKPDAEDDDDEDEAFDTYNTQSLSSLALHNATDVVDRLYKLSYRIRNPATRLGFSKALQFRQDDPETGRELIKEFEEQDLRHVQEIFAILQGKPAAEIARNFLVKRLAKANTRRRQQFYHWKNHRLKMEHSSKCVDLPGIPTAGMTSQRSVFLLTPSEVHHPAPSQPSSATGHRDAALDLDDGASILSDTTSVMISGSSDCERLTLPDLPERLRRKKELECPYCFILCSGATVNRKSGWQ